jgi:hypothetical protein
MSVDRHIVVRAGVKICLRRSAIKLVFTNINLSDDWGVYCKIALIVPCNTSELVWPINSIKSVTNSGVIAMFSLAYPAGY